MKKSNSINSLSDLARVKADLAACAKAQAQAKALQQAQEAAAQRDKHLFASAVGKVAPIKSTGVAPAAMLPASRPAPLPLQQLQDDKAVLLESLSDDFDVETLLDADDSMSYRQSGIGQDVTRRLRQGVWAIQAQLDLHGLRTEQARQALTDFIGQAAQQGLRCVRVVHGKGLGSVGKTPVLKARVQRWLVQKQAVLAFVQARPIDGGAGALVVLLQSKPAK